MQLGIPEVGYVYTSIVYQYTRMRVLKKCFSHLFSVIYIYMSVYQVHAFYYRMIYMYIYRTCVCCNIILCIIVDVYIYMYI